MIRTDIHINSILAVIYLTKLQNLINRPVMNCSMSIFPYCISISQIISELIYKTVRDIANYVV
jgi:hypothetical protein